MGGPLGLERALWCGVLSPGVLSPVDFYLRSLSWCRMQSLPYVKFGAQCKIGAIRDAMLVPKWRKAGAQGQGFNIIHNGQPVSRRVVLKEIKSM